MSGELHKHTFENWRARLPARTKLVVDVVVETLVPQLEERGFGWVDDLLNLGQGYINRADDIPMQRKADRYCDVVSIGFSKKCQPNFSINFRRWTEEELARGEMWLPHYLSKRTSEGWRAKRFGFNCMDPFVTSARCRKLINQTIALLPQMDECFESGKIGPNITKSQFISLRK